MINDYVFDDIYKTITPDSQYAVGDIKINPARCEVFGEAVSIARKNLGMTQEDLAERLGYKSKSSIVGIEQGKNALPREYIGKLAEILQVSESKVRNLSGYLYAIQSYFDLIVNSPIGEKIAIEFERNSVDEMENHIRKYSVPQVLDLIRVQRERKNLSQYDLAERLGYTSKTSIAKIESGATPLPMDKIEKLAKVIDVPEDVLYVISSENRKQYNKRTNPGRYQEELHGVQKKLEYLSPGDLQKVSQIIDVFLNQ